MTWLITFLLGILGSASVIFFTHKSIKNIVAKRSQSEDSLSLNTQNIINKLLSEINHIDKLASVKQKLSLEQTITALNNSIITEQNELIRIEQLLSTRQHEVEDREIKIQSVKTANEEEIEALKNLSENLENLTNESAELEESLEGSLNDLNRLGSEIEMTREQRAKLDDYSSTLEQARKNLQELAYEAQESERRLKLLSQQFNSLEQEYSKLIEQQFA
jgi:chromosome segregation ATPase